MNVQPVGNIKYLKSINIKIYCGLHNLPVYRVYYNVHFTLLLHTNFDKLWINLYSSKSLYVIVRIEISVQFCSDSHRFDDVFFSRPSRAIKLYITCRQFIENTIQSHLAMLNHYTVFAERIILFRISVRPCATIKISLSSIVPSRARTHIIIIVVV